MGFQLIQPPFSFRSGGYWIVVLAVIGIGDSRYLPPHLVKHQQGVAEHPAAIRPVVIAAGMHRNTGLDPVDEFVTPEAKQLTHRGKSWDWSALVGGEALAQQFKGVALE